MQAIPDIHWKDLEMVRCLGGKVGVKLCRLRDGAELCVVKESPRELTALSSVPPSPRIVRVLGRVHLDNGSFGVVLEHLTGGDLETLVVHHSALFAATTLPQRALMALDAAKALQHLHTHRILVRDLAMRNLMLTSSDSLRLKLIDLGWSLPMGDSGPATVETATLQCGPWRVLAPESVQTSCNAQFSTASDVWSLGVLCFGLATGIRPYASVAGDNVRAAVASGVGPGAQSLADASLSMQPLCTVATACLRPLPQDRPSLDSIVQMLESIC